MCEATYGNAFDGRELLVEAAVKLDVREALDTGAADPIPGGFPGKGCPTQGRELGAVSPRRCAGSTPLIEKQRIRARSDSVPLS